MKLRLSIHFWTFDNFFVSSLFLQNIENLKFQTEDDKTEDAVKSYASGQSGQCWVLFGTKTQMGQVYLNNYFDFHVCLSFCLSSAVRESENKLQFLQ